MSSLLLKSVGKDAVGMEFPMRIVGTRDAPAKMVVQVMVEGTAEVQVQGRITKDAPWANVGPLQRTSGLYHVDAVQFLRATAVGVAAESTVCVWVAWGW